MININANYENFDFSNDLNDLKNKVFGTNFDIIKNLSQKQNLTQPEKQYLENNLGKFLNNFLQKAKADPNSYQWNSWNIIKDLNLQNFQNSDLISLAKLSNQDKNTRKNNLPNYLANYQIIKIFDTKNSDPSNPSFDQNIQPQLEVQKDIFPIHFAIQKKVDSTINEGKNISLFGYNSSTPSLNQLLTQKQNDFIIGFNNLLLEGKNQTIDRQKFLTLAQNYGLEKGNYTLFVENNLGSEPFINIAYGDNIGISFGKNILPSYENLINLKGEISYPENRNQNPITIQPSQLITQKTTNTSNPNTNSPKPSVSQPAPDPKNYINSSDPNLKNAPIVSAQKNNEQKKSNPNAITSSNSQILNPTLKKDLTEIAKDSLTPLDLANLKDSDFIKTNVKKTVPSSKLILPTQIDQKISQKTTEKGVGGEIGSGTFETQKLKTFEQKKEYLKKIFDSKTVFNIPFSQNIIFEALDKQGKLGTDYIGGGNFVLQLNELKNVDDDYLVYATVKNMTYDNHIASYKPTFRVNLGTLDQVLSQVDSRKQDKSFENGKVEVGEYNSNQVFNYMLATNFMLENQTGIKNGENFSFSKYFDTQKLLASGQLLPSKDGKANQNSISHLSNLIGQTINSENGKNFGKYENGTFQNTSGKTLYIHLKPTIIDRGRLRNDPKQPENLQGLSDNSTTWINQCWIDDKKPSLEEINEVRKEFKDFLDRRNWLKNLHPNIIGF